VLQGLPCRVRFGCATCRILQNYVRRHARHRWVPCTDCMCKTDATEHQCICFDALELCWGILGHVGTQHWGQAPAAAYAGTWSTRSPGVCHCNKSHAQMWDPVLRKNVDTYAYSSFMEFCNIWISIMRAITARLASCSPPPSWKTAKMTHAPSTAQALNHLLCSHVRRAMA
jgi:hypothetical protein